MKASQFRVLGLGQPIIDNIIHVDFHELEEIGIEEIGGSQMIKSKEEFEQLLENINLVIKKRKDESPISVNNNILVPGGSCANTIKAMQCLGERCAILGKIGKDERGNFYKKYMIEKGVYPLLLECSTDRTAEVICLITPDKQRTMRAFLGCSTDITPEDIKEEFFKGISLLHLDGYNIYNEDVTLKAAQLAKKNNALVSLDLGSFELVRKHKPQLINLITKYVDIVLCNEKEAAEVANFHPVQDIKVAQQNYELSLTNHQTQQMDHSISSLISEHSNNPEVEACLKGLHMISHIAPLAVVMMGEKGCLVKHSNHTSSQLCNFFTLNGECFHFMGRKIEKQHIRDTTGAGDNFASGFLFGILQPNSSLKKCAHMGCLMGSSVIQFSGSDIPDHYITKLREEQFEKL